MPAVGVVIGADPAATSCSPTRRVAAPLHGAPTPRDGFDVTDLGSRNGTWLDGMRGHPGDRAARRARSASAAPCSSCSRPRRPSTSRQSTRDSFGAMVGEPVAMRADLRAARARAAVDARRCCSSARAAPARSWPRAPSTTASRARERPVRGLRLRRRPRDAHRERAVRPRRGAFTGATGRPRRAPSSGPHGGTLFLDEIGELPLGAPAQAPARCSRPARSRRSAARKPRARRRARRRRHQPRSRRRGRRAAPSARDLYYRLAVVEVHLPPLRERREDIPVLVRALPRPRAARPATPGRSRSPNARPTARPTRWPGNVRELRNVIARAVALAAPDATLRLDARPARGADRRRARRRARPSPRRSCPTTRRRTRC